MTHSQGQWKLIKAAEGFAGTTGDKDIGIVAGGIIAEVFYRIDDNKYADVEANARLIAAAPALVALVNAVEWVRDVEGNFHCPWCYALKEIDHFEDCKRQQALAQVGE